MYEEIKAEIEHRIKEWQGKLDTIAGIDRHFGKGVICEYESFLFFIESLEKEIIHKDLGEDMNIVFNAISKVCNTMKPEEFARYNETVYKVAMMALAIKDSTKSLEKKQDVAIIHKPNMTLSEMVESIDGKSAPKIKGWIVRDSFGLEFYRKKPYRVIGEISHWTDELGPNSEWFLDESLFPELKWEDDPIEVELKINKL